MTYLCQSTAFSVEEDRWRWLWGDLRGPGPSQQRSRGPQVGIRQATETSSQDGSSSPQETAR